MEARRLHPPSLKEMRRALFVTAGILTAVPVVGYTLWRRRSSEIERAILSGATPADGVVTPDRLADVPEPVARFFKHTFSENQRIIRAARIRQTGEFLLNGSWRPMRADQLFSATPPGFLWDARISVAPFMPVYVRDAYVDGRAVMRADLLALYPFVDQAGAPELNAGALLRYLGEAAWFPTRLLPGNGLSWRGIDENSAEATLTDGPTTVSLQFRVDLHGALIELYSPTRFREVRGAYVPTPWRVRALGEEVVGGVRMMNPSVVEWILPEGPLPYWRGRITQATYTY
jgi:hypothetical protein